MLSSFLDIVCNCAVMSSFYVITVSATLELRSSSLSSEFKTFLLTIWVQCHWSTPRGRYYWYMNYLNTDWLCVVCNINVSFIQPLLSFSTNSTCTDFYVNWVHIFCSPKIMQKIFAFKNGLAISYFLLTLLYLRQCGLLALSVIIYECVSYDLVNRLAHHNIRPLFSFNCINPLQ